MICSACSWAEEDSLCLSLFTVVAVNEAVEADLKCTCFPFRADLEAARTLADQIRRREKLHKQDMAAWKLQLEEHLYLPADDEVST